MRGGGIFNCAGFVYFVSMFFREGDEFGKALLNIPLNYHGVTFHLLITVKVERMVLRQGKLSQVVPNPNFNLYCSDCNKMKKLGKRAVCNQLKRMLD